MFGLCSLIELSVLITIMACNMLVHMDQVAPFVCLFCFSVVYNHRLNLLLAQGIRCYE